MDAQAVQWSLRPNLPGAPNRKSRLLASRWVEVSCQDTRGSCDGFRKQCVARSITTSASALGCWVLQL